MFERFLRNFRQESNPRPVLSLDVELLLTLEQLALEEQRGLDELAAELLWGAVSERHAAARNFQPWQELTPRERQTAALACLGHTNREIAEMMVISTNTVKTHMRHVLRKLGFEIIRSKKHETWQKIMGNGSILQVRISHKGKRDIPRVTFYEMLRQAGIDEKTFISILK